MTPGKFNLCPELQKVVSILIFVNIKNFIDIVLYYTKRRYSQIEPHLTVKIEVGCEAP